MESDISTITHDISMMDKSIEFPKKPTFMPQLRQKCPPVTLLSNYLKISLKSKERSIKQYAIKYEPEIPADNGHLRKIIIRQLTPQLNEFYEPFSDSGDCFFSPKDVNEEKTFAVTINRDNKEPDEDNLNYTVLITKTRNEIDLLDIKQPSLFSAKVKNFIEVLIKKILNANLGLVRFNKRNFFDWNNLKHLQDAGII
jgi:hypothetical protein